MTFQEWIDITWVHIVVLIAGFVALSYLINFIILLIVNLFRKPKYDKFKQYKKLKIGMTKYQVEQVMRGVKIRRETSTYWTCSAVWRTRLNEDSYYTVKMYFDINGVLKNVDLSIRTKTWYWQHR